MKLSDQNLIASLRVLRLQRENTQKSQTLWSHRITSQTANELRQLGFVISVDNGNRFHLIKESDKLFPENIISWRDPAHENKPVFVFETTHSTMDAAARQIAQIQPDDSRVHGAIWAANGQTSGRGRMMRHWHSPSGLGCWFSVSLSSQRLETPATASFAAAIAVHNTLLEIGHISTALKWPNDIIHNGKKLCGILVEKTPCGHFFVIGVGLNVFQNPPDFPQEIREKSTSLSQIPGVTPTALNRSRLIARITDKMLETSTLAWEQILADWCSKCLHFQEFVRLEKCGQIHQGIFHDIDASGAIILRDDNGKLTPHHSGELFSAYPHSHVAH